MKTLNTITTAIALLIGTSFGYAQSSVFKNPVSFTLKNGTTVIVAENQASPKVFANLSFEAAAKYRAEKAAIQEVFSTMLNQQLAALDAGLSYSDKGVNLATTTAGFEAAFETMINYISAPKFDEQSLASAKASVLAHLSAQDKYFPETVNAASLAKITLAEVNAYFQEINNPKQNFLTIAGNITPSVAKDYTKKSVDRVKPVVDFSNSYLAAGN
uniref:insulinase family protein n=1 Tax=Pedobacter schmidteae TaxID=2201271 RepID=UPI000EAD0E0A|nr:insulinase family protein [Pedobacter schmidteae]